MNERATFSREQRLELTEHPSGVYRHCRPVLQTFSCTREAERGHRKALKRPDCAVMNMSRCKQRTLRGHYLTIEPCIKLPAVYISYGLAYASYS